MTRLENRTVIVTGAAQGMGAAVAERCRSEGANLVLVDREPVVEDVARRVDGIAFVGDVTSERLATEVVAAALDQPGTLWGLANVAGIHSAGDATSTTDDDWERLISVNLTAPRLWSRAVVPHLLEGGGGSIVIVTSINGSYARPNSLGYTASKTGALGLVRSLAVDYGREGVRTNSISPGSVETPMLLAADGARPAHRDRAVGAHVLAADRAARGHRGRLRVPAERRRRVRQRRRPPDRRWKDGGDLDAEERTNDRRTRQC